MDRSTQRLRRHGAVWLLSGAVLALMPALGQATNIIIDVRDGAGEGFNDQSPRNAVTGNSGQTLGEQRLNVFQAAADYWEERLDSSVDIVVEARFDALQCSPTSGILGQAGPQAVHTNFANIPQPDVLYPGALANSLAGFDLSPNRAEIGTTFNSALDSSGNCLGGSGWDYRLGTNADSARSLYSVVLHELGHGLGFLTFTNLQTGSTLNGRDDIFMRNLFDVSTNRDWANMTDTQRRASSVNSGNLVWTGELAAAESDFLDRGLSSTGLPRMYAPNAVQPGSSVSHWDTALSPDELMEPQSRPRVEDWLTTKAFYDMGWQGNPCVESRLPNDQWIMLSLGCVPPANANTLQAAFGDDIAGEPAGPNVSDPTWSVFRYDPLAGATGDYVRLTANDALEPGVGYWIKQITGNDVFINVPRESARTPSDDINGCPTGRSCFVTSLPSSSDRRTYHLVGNPYRFAVRLNDLRVVTNSGTCQRGCTLVGAAAVGIMPSIAFTRQADSGEGYATLEGSDQIPAKAGIWVATNSASAGLDVRLLFPR